MAVIESFSEPIRPGWQKKILLLVNDWQPGKIDAHSAATFVVRYVDRTQARIFLSLVSSEFINVYRSWMDHNDEQVIRGEPKDRFHDEDLVLAIFEIFRSEVPEEAREPIKSKGWFCRGTSDGGIAVTASCVSVTDSDLEIFSRSGFPPLHRLNLDGSSISDHGLQSLAQHSELQELWLRNTEITGQGLKSLRAPNLRDLRLSNCSRLIPEELDVLCEFPNLKRLDLDHTPLDNAGAKFVTCFMKTDI